MPLDRLASLLLLPANTPVHVLRVTVQFVSAATKVAFLSEAQALRLWCALMAHEKQETVRNPSDYAQRWKPILQRKLQRLRAAGVLLPAATKRIFPMLAQGSLSTDALAETLKLSGAPAIVDVPEVFETKRFALNRLGVHDSQLSFHATIQRPGRNPLRLSSNSNQASANETENWARFAFWQTKEIPKCEVSAETRAVVWDEILTTARAKFGPLHGESFGLNVPLLYDDVNPNDEKSLQRSLRIGPTHLYWLAEALTTLVESNANYLDRYLPTSLPNLDSRSSDENRLLFGDDYAFPARWPDAFLHLDGITNAIAFVGNPQRNRRYQLTIARLVRLCGAKQYRLWLF